MSTSSYKIGMGSGGCEIPRETNLTSNVSNSPLSSTVRNIQANSEVEKLTEKSTYSFHGQQPARTLVDVKSVSAGGSEELRHLQTLYLSSNKDTLKYFHTTVESEHDRLKFVDWMGATGLVQWFNKDLLHTTIVPYIRPSMIASINLASLQSKDLSQNQQQFLKNLFQKPENITALSAEQLLVGINNHLFSYEQLSSVSDQTILKIDFTQLNLSDKWRLTDFLRKRKYLIPQLGNKNFAHLLISGCFEQSKETPFYFSREQIQSLQLDVFTNQSVFNNLFPLDKGYSLTFYLKQGEQHLSYLTSEQIQECLPQGLFNKGMVGYFDGAVISSFDIDWLVKQKNNHESIAKAIGNRWLERNRDNLNVEEFFKLVYNRLVDLQCRFPLLTIPEKIKETDFTWIIQDVGHVYYGVEWLFRVPANLRALKLKDLDHLLPSLNYISLGSGLSAEQIQSIDFKKHQKYGEKILYGIAAVSENGNSHFPYDNKESIGHLTVEQITDCLTAGLFCKETVALLSNDQVRKLSTNTVSRYAVGNLSSRKSRLS